VSASFGALTPCDRRRTSEVRLSGEQIIGQQARGSERSFQASKGSVVEFKVRLSAFSNSWAKRITRTLKP
jgi:hypothetical protein